MKRNDNRFERISSQTLGFGEGAVVLVDKRTGVNYLFYKAGYGGGLTVLVDRDGKPVISAVGTFDTENN